MNLNVIGESGPCERIACMPGFVVGEFQARHPTAGLSGRFGQPHGSNSRTRFPNSRIDRALGIFDQYIEDPAGVGPSGRRNSSRRAITCAASGRLHGEIFSFHPSLNIRQYTTHGLVPYWTSTWAAMRQV